MRVKYTALILALLLLLPFAANAATFTMHPTDDVGQAQLNAALGNVSELYMTACGEAPNIILTIVWHDDVNDRDIEMVINGLAARPTAEQARKMAACVQCGTEFKLTATSRGVIIDAEKRSCIFPDEGFRPLIEEQIGDRSISGGDSFLCWAATASNMLYMTEWAGKAENPVTGVPFRDEDDVFGYFIRGHINDGSFVEDALRWFLYNTGATPVNGTETGGLLPGANCRVSNYGTLNDPVSPEVAADKLTLIKKGYAAGLGMLLYRYITLGEDGKPHAYRTDDGYIVYESLIPDEKDCFPDSLFILQDIDTPVRVVKEGNMYRSESGKTYPPESVLRGDLYRDPETGICRIINKDEDGSPIVYIPVPVDESELETDRPLWIAASAHALTCKGYVADVSVRDRKIIALLLSDSDDDATYFGLTPENAARSSRPDVMRMHFAVSREDENGNIALYMDDMYGKSTENSGTKGKLCQLTVLESSIEMLPDPVPLTGDRAPGPALYIALIAAALCGMAVCAGRFRHSKK